MWRTSRQACLLCPWARHLTGRLRLYVADRWWGRAVYPSWWPSLTKDMQTEHELIRVIIITLDLALLLGYSWPCSLFPLMVKSQSYTARLTEASEVEWLHLQLWDTKIPWLTNMQIRVFSLKASSIVEYFLGL